MKSENQLLHQNIRKETPTDQSERQSAMEFLKHKTEKIAEMKKWYKIYEEQNLDKLPLEKIKQMQDDVEQIMTDQKEGEDQDTSEIMEYTEEIKRDEAGQGKESTPENVAAERSDAGSDLEDAGSKVLKTESTQPKPKSNKRSKKKQTKERQSESSPETIEKQSRPEKSLEKKTFVNDVEKKDDYNDFTRHNVAEMIKSGKTDEEIWEAAKEHGFFFKFDGASYYLGKNGQWRNRSAKGNTSGGVSELKIKKRIGKQIENYRNLDEWFDDPEDAFEAADLLHANNVKGRAYMNKMGPMSKYWDKIKNSDTSNPEDENLSDANKKNMNSEQPSTEASDENPEEIDKAEEAKSEKPKDVSESMDESDTTSKESVENQESTEKINEGDKVYYMEKELRRWPEPKEIKKIKIVDGDQYAKFDDDDSLYPITKLQKSESINIDESEYKPGPGDVAPSSEDLESAPNASEVVHEAEEEIPEELADNPDAQKNTNETEQMEKFKSRFGISYEELKNIKDFPQDPAKQRWVLENLTQLTMGRIESEAEKRRENALDATIPDEWKSDAGGRLKNFFNSLKSTAVRFQEGLEKENHTATFKKQIIKEIEGGGVEKHGAVIKLLLDSLNQADFEIRINEETDELELDFISVPEGATEAQAEIIQNYNEAARIMADTPHEWQHDSATRSQHKQHEESKANYDEMRKKLTASKLDHGELKGDDLAVSEYLYEKDFAVEMNQLLNTNPGLSDEIEKISNQSVWWQTTTGAFNKKNAINIAIGAGGTATRWATASGTFGFGAAASGFAVGALRGKREAGRKIRKKEEGARYGGIDNMSGIGDLTEIRDQISDTEQQIVDGDDDEQITELKKKRKQLLGRRDELLKRDDIRQKLYEAGAFVDAKGLIERLERDISLVEDSESESNQRKNRLRSLDSRIEYAVNKLDQGIVNFGSDPADIAFAKMNLTKFLAKAQVVMGTHSYTGTPSENGGTSPFEKWRDSVGLKDQEEIKKARKVFERKEMLTAGAVSGSFFAAGYFGRMFGETLGWWGGQSAADSFDSTTKITADSPEILEGAPDTPSSTGSTAVESNPLTPVGADTVGAGTGNENPLESNLETTTADSAEVKTPQPIEPVDSAEGVATVEAGPEAIGVQEITIDEKGEGMIHAIADKLEDDFELSHEKAMRIGNELYIKGEEIQGGVEEMYNLIGRDATFSLDFGDLTEADLDAESPEDLAESIIFSQDSVDSDVKGLELPEQDSPNTAVNKYYGEENPINAKKIDSVTIDDATESTIDAWRKQAEAAGVKIGDSQESAVPNMEREFSAIDELKTTVAESDVVDEIQSEINERINAARLRGTSTSRGIMVSDLDKLQDFLYTNGDSNLIDSIDLMRQENPRLLRTLDQVLEVKNNEPGSLMDKIDRYVSTGLGDMTIEADAAPEDAVASGIEALKTEVDQVSVDKLQAMTTHMSAQAYVEPEYIDVPAERINFVEDFLEENSTRSTSDLIMKMSNESPEGITAFERIMNLDDSGDVIDRKSMRPVYKMTQELVSNLTEENFPNGMPEYARLSINASIDAIRA